MEVNGGLIAGLVIFFLILIVFCVFGYCYRKKIKQLCDRRKTRVQTPPIAVSEFKPPIIINYVNMSGQIPTNEKLPPPIELNNFSEYVTNLMQSRGVPSQFEILKQLIDTQKTVYMLTTHIAAIRPELNRYTNYLPYDQTIVFNNQTWNEYLVNTWPKSIDQDEVSTTYINASYIKTCKFDQQGKAMNIQPAVKPTFIATQGCKLNTVADFLHMLMQQRVPIIVLLTNSIELGKHKCEDYWSNRTSTRYLSKYKDCYVHQEMEIPHEFGTSRTLVVTSQTSGMTRSVTHYQFLSWPVVGMPDMDQFYEFLVGYMDMIAQLSSQDDFGPHVIQCSSGSRRSGLFICATILLEQLRKKPTHVDVLGTVLEVTRCRINLICGEEQLDFLFKFLSYCIIKENINFDGGAQCTQIMSDSEHSKIDIEEAGCEYVNDDEDHAVT